jgi:hypothetical protein
MVLAPPSALGSPWMRRLGPVSTGFASGWMRLRGVRRRRAADRGFVVSDHADWDGLNDAIAATGAERVFVTHGYTSQFSRWLREKGYEAGWSRRSSAAKASRTSRRRSWNDPLRRRPVLVLERRLPRAPDARAPALAEGAASRLLLPHASRPLRRAAPPAVSARTASLWLTHARRPGGRAAYLLHPWRRLHHRQPAQPCRAGGSPRGPGRHARLSSALPPRAGASLSRRPRGRDRALRGDLRGGPAPGRDRRRQRGGLPRPATGAAYPRHGPARARGDGADRAGGRPFGRSGPPLRRGQGRDADPARMGAPHPRRLPSRHRRGGPRRLAPSWRSDRASPRPDPGRRGGGAGVGRRATGRGDG